MARSISYVKKKIDTDTIPAEPEPDFRPEDLVSKLSDTEKTVNIYSSTSSISNTNQAVSVKNLIFNYDYVVTRNTNSNFTVKITIKRPSLNSEFTPNLNKTSRWIGIKIDGSNVVGCTASKFPTVASYTKKHPGLKKSQVKQAVKSAIKDKMNSAYVAFDNKLNSNKSKTITMQGNPRNIVIDFQAFGYYARVTIKLNVSISSTSSGQNANEYENEYLSISSVNNGIPYLINNATYKEYGWIERVVDFSDVEDASTLKALGETYLQSMQFDDMQLSIKALDLHYVNKQLPILKLLDNVRCVSKPHGLDKYFPITEIDIPLDQPDQVTYTMGNTSASGISASTSSDAQKFTKQMEDTPTVGYALDYAKAEMSTLLNQHTQGYVNIIQVDNSGNDTSSAQAIVISDTEDWTQANKLWKWDMNGLGFSDKKISQMTNSEKSTYQTLYGAGKATSDSDRWYKLGITNNGTIVADVIKTGILSDGLGYNYWNLETGAFSLQYTATNIIDGTGNTVTSLSKLVTDTSTAKSNASTALTNSNTALTNSTVGRYKQSTSGNLLTGTAQIKLDGSGYWSNKTWKGSSSDGYGITWGTKNFSDKKSRPSSAIRNYFYFDRSLKSNQAAGGCYGGIKQDAIPISPNTTYTLSFYAYVNTNATLGNASVKITVGNTWTQASSNSYVKSTKSVTSAKKWTRYSFVFKTANQPKTISSNTASYITDTNGNCLISVAIEVRRATNVMTRANCYIAGPMLSEGNSTPSWASNESDQFEDLTTYTDDMAAAVSTAEAQNRQALANAINSEYVFNKLTNYGKIQGLFLTPTGNSGHVYINAQYIATNVSKVNLLYAKTIADRTGSNWWNLDAGVITTNNMVAKGLKATGYIETGSGSTIAKLKNGQLTFYSGKKMHSYIDGTGLVDEYRNHRFYKTHKGIVINGDCIMFRMKTGSVYDPHKSHGIKYTYTTLYTGDMWFLVPGGKRKICVKNGLVTCL